jgi:hypothetical protein
MPEARLAVDNRNIPEVKVAMTAADQSLSASLDKQGLQPRKRRHRLAF